MKNNNGSQKAVDTPINGDNGKMIEASSQTVESINTGIEPTNTEVETPDIPLVSETSAPIVDSDASARYVGSSYP